MVKILSKMKFTFEAAHKLSFNGEDEDKRSRLHGHSWYGQVAFEAEASPNWKEKRGIPVLDAEVEIKHSIDWILEAYLNYHLLNETLGIKHPTCLEVAQWLYNMLSPRIPKLVSIEISGGCTGDGEVSRDRIG